MRKTHIYVKNISDEVQKIKHPRLAGLAGLPSSDNGFIPITGLVAEIPPKVAVQLPIKVWTLTPGLYRQRWAQDISEADWLKLCEVAISPCENCEKLSAEVERLTAKLKKLEIAEYDVQPPKLKKVKRK